MINKFLSRNKLKSLNGLKNLPELQSLNVNENKIKEFGTVEVLPKL